MKNVFTKITYMVIGAFVIWIVIDITSVPQPSKQKQTDITPVPQPSKQKQTDITPVPQPSKQKQWESSVKEFKRMGFNVLDVSESQ